MDNTRCYQCDRCCNKKEKKTCVYKKQQHFNLEENSLYEQSCNRMAFLFGEKHGWRFEGWAGYFDPNKNTWQEGTGGWALYGDWIVPMDDIRADLMMDASADEWIKYNDACMKEAEKNIMCIRINYRSWLMGARFDGDILDSPYIKRKKEIQRNIEQYVTNAMNMLKQSIRNDKPF